MELEIKEGQQAAWEWAAAKAGGVSVAALAQKHLDNQGEVYAAQMREADRAEQAALFDLALKLSPESRTVLRQKVLELAAAEEIAPPA